MAETGNDVWVREIEEADLLDFFTRLLKESYVFGDSYYHMAADAYYRKFEAFLSDWRVNLNLTPEAPYVTEEFWYAVGKEHAGVPCRTKEEAEKHEGAEAVGPFRVPAMDLSLAFDVGEFFCSVADAEQCYAGYDLEDHPLSQVDPADMMNLEGRIRAVIRQWQKETGNELRNHSSNWDETFGDEVPF